MRFWVLVALILGAALVRLAPHPANFVPIAAVALFAGSKIEDRRLAVLVPLVAMFLSDAAIGFHQLMHVVYLAFALIVLIGIRLGPEVGAGGIASGGIGGSMVFFLVTNFAVWLMPGATYPPTIDGLIQCYVAGIPYFLRTLAGTLFYSGVLFGGLSLLERRFPVLAGQATS